MLLFHVASGISKKWHPYELFQVPPYFYGSWLFYRLIFKQGSSLIYRLLMYNFMIEKEAFSRTIKWEIRAQNLSNLRHLLLVTPAWSRNTQSMLC